MGTIKIGVRLISFFLILVLFLWGSKYFFPESYSFIVTRSKGYETYIWNYFKIIEAQADTLFVTVKDMDYDELRRVRSNALKRGVLKERKYVDAILGYKKKLWFSKIRIKGLFRDHWADENNWSFKLENKSGKWSFDLNVPETRGSLNEIFLNQILKENKQVYSSYCFVYVFINGKNLGLYALEDNNNYYKENQKVIVEDNILLSFSKDMLYDDFSGNYQRTYVESEIKIDHCAGFSDSIIKSAVNLLDDYRNRKKTASEVFDMEKTSALLALTELFGNHHHIQLHNIKFLYNQKTKMLEPIASDVVFKNLIYVPTLSEAIKLKKEDNKVAYNSITWERDLFSDTIFKKLYLKNIKIVSDKIFLDQLLAKIKNNVDEQYFLIKKNNPAYIFDVEEILYLNQEKIRHLLKTNHYQN